MNSKPKIIVLKMREIIYTVLLLLLIILLAVCLILMFSPKTAPEKTGQVPQSTQSESQQTQSQSLPSQDAQNQQAQPQTTQNRPLPSQDTQDQQAQPQITQSQPLPSQDTQDQQAQPQATQSRQTTPASGSTLYTPGVYRTSVMLGESAADVEVTVSSDRITAIRLVNLSESVSAAFPLVSPCLDQIAEQILETQSLEQITCPSENRYTGQVLLSAIADALAIAKNQ